MTDFTNMFSPYDFERNDDIILTISKMNECNSIETIDRTILTEPTKIRLNKITQIENYFHQEINQRKLCSKKLSKYVTAFDYIDKVLIALSAASVGAFVISFTSVVGAPVGIESKFYFNFFFVNRNSQKCTRHNKKKKKRKSMIKFLCWLKVNSIALKL